MRGLLVACSVQAYQRMEQVKALWIKERSDWELITLVKCRDLPEQSEKESLSVRIGQLFADVDAIVFFSAVGIAVRLIAPYIRHKSKDPAVVVIDETASFCISLLSGHAGGANELAEWLAKETGALPVITTATDREHKFAVDEFARKNALTVADWKLAKELSVRILRGETILGIGDGEFEVKGCMPKEVIWRTGQKPFQRADLPYQAGFIVSSRRLVQSNDGFDAESAADAQRNKFSGPFLQLIPKNTAIGIGCRRGTAKMQIEEAFFQCLEKANLCRESVFAIASIDLKAKEEGILSFCREQGLLFLTYSSDELAFVPGSFSESAFVKEVTGVSNVCERSAMAACGIDGMLICKKAVYGGVTTAAAQKKGSVEF